MTLSEQFYKETGFYSQEWDSENERYYYIEKYIEWLENKTIKNSEKIEELSNVANELFNYAWDLATDGHDYSMLIKIKDYYKE